MAAASVPGPVTARIQPCVKWLKELEDALKPNGFVPHPINSASDSATVLEILPLFGSLRSGQLEMTCPGSYYFDADVEPLKALAAFAEIARMEMQDERRVYLYQALLHHGLAFALQSNNSAVDHILHHLPAAADTLVRVARLTVDTDVSLAAKLVLGPRYNCHDYIRAFIDEEIGHSPPDVSHDLANRSSLLFRLVRSMRSRIDLPGHLIGDNALSKTKKAVSTLGAKIEEAKKKHNQCLAELVALGEPPDHYKSTRHLVETKLADLAYGLDFPRHTGEDAVRVAQDWDKLVAVLGDAQRVASQFAAKARSRTLPCLQADLEKATTRYKRVVELHDCWREELEQWTLALKTIISERFLPAVTHDNDPKFGIVMRDMEVSAFDCLWIQAESNDADAASLILKELSTQLQQTLKCIHNYPALFPAALRSSIGALVANDCCKIVDSYVLG